MSIQRIVSLILLLLGPCSASCEDEEDGLCSNMLLQKHLDIAPKDSPQQEDWVMDVSQNFMVDRIVRQRGFKRRVLDLQVTHMDLNLLEVPKQMFFFTHHKSGTVLARSLAIELASELQERHTKYMWETYEKRHTGHFPGCAPTAVATYQNMNRNILERIQTSDQCSGFRSIHFIREAAATTVSAYLYHSDPSHSNDYVKEGLDSYEDLRRVDAKHGLLQEAKAQEEFTLKDMEEVHAGLVNDPNSLVVGLEEFEMDYDGTTRKIFSFLLGSSHAKIDTLVQKVKAYDTNAWSDSQLEQVNHVADKDETSKTLELFLEMKDESVVQEVLKYDKKLGYDVPSE